MQQIEITLFLQADYSQNFVKVEEGSESCELTDHCFCLLDSSLPLHIHFRKVFISEARIEIILGPETCLLILY